MNYPQEVPIPKDIPDTGRFLEGINDCKQGRTHKPNMGECYDRGYSAQYELEMALGAFK